MVNSNYYAMVSGLPSRCSQGGFIMLDSPASRLGKLGVDSSPLAPASVVHDFMLCEDPIWGPCVRSPCAYGSPAHYLTVRTPLYCIAKHIHGK